MRTSRGKANGDRSSRQMSWCFLISLKCRSEIIWMNIVVVVDLVAMHRNSSLIEGSVAKDSETLHVNEECRRNCLNAQVVWVMM